MKNYILSICLIIISFSCRKNEPTIPSTQVPEEGYVTAKVNNRVFSDTANAIVNNVNKTIFISSWSSYDHLVILIDGINKGKYVAGGNSKTLIKYIDRYGKIYSSTGFGSGTINITLLDTVSWKLGASFEGELFEVNGNDNIHISFGNYNTIPYREPIGGGSNIPVNNSLSLTVDTVDYISNRTYASAGPQLQIVSNDVGGWFRIMFPVILKPGTYDYSTTQMDILYQDDTKSPYNYTPLSGKIIIETNDFFNNTVTGKFDFVLSSGVDTKTISNGSFAVVY